MAARKFPVPPTYAEPTIVEPNSGRAQFNPIWLKWFLDVAQFLSDTTTALNRQIDHNALGNLEGGAPGQYYHLTVAQINEFFVNPMVQDADIIVGGTGGAPTRLGVGAVGTKLTVAAGNILQWT